jgi:hypothetical protein
MNKAVISLMLMNIASLKQTSIILETILNLKQNDEESYEQTKYAYYSTDVFRPLQMAADQDIAVLLMMCCIS